MKIVLYAIQVEKMPPSVSSGVQCTPEVLYPDEWQWLKIQKVSLLPLDARQNHMLYDVSLLLFPLQVLVRSAWQGIIIGLTFALPILILATQNYILGTMATLSVACTTFTVVGMIYLLGWKLGVRVIIELLLNCSVGCAVEHHICCRTIEPGLAGDIGAVEI